MTLVIAHLGPSGTYAQAAALTYAELLQQAGGQPTTLHPCGTIAQTLKAVADRTVDYAVVPVENSIEGSVSMTLDTLWQLDWLQVQQAIVLPIRHALASHAKDLTTIKTIYSHPQALAQCQDWLATHLNHPQLVPISSTAEALKHLTDESIGAVTSLRAAQINDVAILAYPINDYPDNCTRFWALNAQPSRQGSHTSIAFSLKANLPGALVMPLQAFASLGINLSKIESRPTKRSLGEYVFFVDLEGNLADASIQSALDQLTRCTETLKIFGSYSITTVTTTN